MKRLKQRQRLILEALINCGRRATTHQIAFKTKLHVNGVSQTLGALDEYVELVPRVPGTVWRLKVRLRNVPALSRALWKKLNKRRVELIGKRVDRCITSEESVELEDLQKTAGRVREAASSLRPVARH